MFQVDKDKFVWQERQFNLKVDLAEIPERVSTYCESSIADLKKDIQKLRDEKNMLILKLEEASREPGAVVTIHFTKSNFQTCLAKAGNKELFALVRSESSYYKI